MRVLKIMRKLSTREDVNRLLAEGDGKNVVIPEGVKIIGAYTFFGRESLESVTLPASVTTISERAFMQCKNLKKVAIAEGSKLKTIGTSAFWGCKSLESVAFEQCSQLKTIGAGAFPGCPFKNIELPTSVNYIHTRAFHSCMSLESITIPKGASIGRDAFGYCPAEIKYVGEKKPPLADRMADAKARSEARDSGRDVKNKDEYTI